MSIDLTAELMNENATADVGEVEKAALSSGEIPPGRYHARLEGASQRDAGETPTWEMLFQILAGPFTGRKVKYTLWMGTKGTDKDGSPLSVDALNQAKQLIKNEFWHTAGVLGLATKISPSVYKKVPGKHDFRDVLGAECVIITKLRPSTKEGDDRKFAEVQKFGCVRTDDPKAKGAVLAAPGSSRPPVATAQAAVAQQDLSDLV